MQMSSVPPSRTLRSVVGSRRVPALFCILLFFAQAEKGQSGRAPKPELPSRPAPTENQTKPDGTKDPQQNSSLVIINSVNSAKVSVWTSLAIRELIGRIKESSNVSVAREKDMSRKD